MQSITVRKPAPFEKYNQPVGDRYIDVLDGVRAVLVLLVGAFHIWQQSWLTPHFTLFGQRYSLDFLLRSGYIWVDGLILLSGFLLYLPYARAGENKLPPVGPFLLKRFLRIWPSYALNVILFFFLAVQKYNGNGAFMAKDLITHLTFTHTFFYDTYYGSPINGGLWTVGVEWWFYLLFPLLGRCYKKKPMLTALGMMTCAFAFRAYASTLPDTRMWFNQLPAFLDVYALGFIGADAFVALRGNMLESGKKEKRLFSLICLLCVILLVYIAKAQASSNGQEGIRLGQMAHRFPLALCLLVLMISACFASAGVRFLLGNRVMRFLSAVSFQFYMYHQVLCVQIRERRLIPSVSETPNRDGEWPWQPVFTLCSFLLPILLGAILTYGFEKPIIRYFGKMRSRKKK